MLALVPPKPKLFDRTVSRPALSTRLVAISLVFNAGSNSVTFADAVIKSFSNIINEYSENELADLIFKYGDEHKSRRIAREIIKRRPVFTTMELANLIKNLFGSKHTKIHPATKTFQALRIEVNGELNNLFSVLSDSLKVLRTGGRIIVISYHSLEDRIVKNFFKNESKDCLCPIEILICECEHSQKLKLITNKVNKPSSIEIASNPRSRSAKLRVAELI